MSTGADVGNTATRPTHGKVLSNQRASYGEIAPLIQDRSTRPRRRVPGDELHARSQVREFAVGNDDHIAEVRYSATGRRHTAGESRRVDRRCVSEKSLNKHSTAKAVCCHVFRELAAGYCRVGTEDPDCTAVAGHRPVAVKYRVRDVESVLGRRNRAARVCGQVVDKDTGQDIQRARSSECADTTTRGIGRVVAHFNTFQRCCAEFGPQAATIGSNDHSVLDRQVQERGSRREDIEDTVD